jgi:hypothetical protein
MSSDPSKRPPEADADLEREIRAERKFSMAEAIGRAAGPGMMKGVSPVTPKRQAEAEIREYLTRHLSDTAGVLPDVLLRLVGESDLMLQSPDRPLEVLAGYVRRVLDSDYRLKELVREADVEWGRVYGERPYFDQKGRPPDPNDPYTQESVRVALSRFLATLRGSET